MNYRDLLNYIIVLVTIFLILMISVSAKNSDYYNNLLDAQRYLDNRADLLDRLNQSYNRRLTGSNRLIYENKLRDLNIQQEELIQTIVDVEREIILESEY